MRFFNVNKVQSEFYFNPLIFRVKNKILLQNVYNNKIKDKTDKIRCLMVT